MKRVWLICVFCLLCILFSSSVSAATNGPLKVSTSNKRYFQDASGKAIYLTGSHHWSLPWGKNEDIHGQIDALAAMGHNFTRLWAWEVDQYPDDSCNPYSLIGTPYSGSVGNYNLNTWNDAFFTRLADTVSYARSKNVYVSVMFFEGWTVNDYCDGWNSNLNLHARHPYRTGNNTTGPSVTMNGNGETHDLNTSTILATQKKLIDKIIATVDQYDNVIYEIANESGTGSASWQQALVTYTKTKTSKPVGMTALADDNNSNQAIYNSAADWMSEHGYEDGGALTTQVRAATGNKVSLLDTDHIFGIGGTSDWIWKAFVRGHNPIYMEPWPITTSYSGSDGDMRRAQGQTRTASSYVDLAKMTPSTSAYQLTASDNTAFISYAANLNVGSGTFTVYRFTKTGTINPTATTEPGPTISCNGCIGLVALKNTTSTTPTPSPSSQPGDLDGNGLINGADSAALLHLYNTSSTFADLIADGKINLLDFASVIKNSSTSPSTTTLVVGFDDLPITTNLSGIEGPGNCLTIIPAGPGYAEERLADCPFDWLQIPNNEYPSGYIRFQSVNWWTNEYIPDSIWDKVTSTTNPLYKKTRGISTSNNTITSGTLTVLKPGRLVSFDAIYPWNETSSSGAPLNPTTCKNKVSGTTSPNCSDVEVLCLDTSANKTLVPDFKSYIDLGTATTPAKTFSTNWTGTCTTIQVKVSSAWVIALDNFTFLFP